MRALMVLTTVAIMLALPAAASERICGWCANPTPGDLLITDRRGDWWITGGGAGADAKGIDKTPQLDSSTASSLSRPTFQAPVTAMAAPA